MNHNRAFPTDGTGKKNHTNYPVMSVLLWIKINMKLQEMKKPKNLKKILLKHPQSNFLSFFLFWLHIWVAENKYAFRSCFLVLHFYHKHIYSRPIICGNYGKVNSKCFTSVNIDHSMICALNWRAYTLLRVEIKAPKNGREKTKHLMI